MLRIFDHECTILERQRFLVIKSSGMHFKVVNFLAAAHVISLLFPVTTFYNFIHGILAFLRSSSDKNQSTQFFLVISFPFLCAIFKLDGSKMQKWQRAFKSYAHSLPSHLKYWKQKIITLSLRRIYNYDTIFNKILL